MTVRTPSERPMILASRFRNGKIVDRRVPERHQAILLELPILVSIRSIPMAGVVVPLVSETHRDAVPGERPHFLDQPVIEFLLPLAREKSDDVLASVDELGSV